MQNNDKKLHICEHVSAYQNYAYIYTYRNFKCIMIVWQVHIDEVEVSNEYSAKCFKYWYIKKSLKVAQFTTFKLGISSIYFRYKRLIKVNVCMNGTILI